MKLQPNPFELIKRGSKTIEIRLNDEKRQEVKVGDLIEFSLATDPVEKINAEVVDLYNFQTFSELFDSYPVFDFGCINKDQLMGMRKYYSDEDEKKYGVLGVRIRLGK